MKINQELSTLLTQTGLSSAGLAVRLGVSPQYVSQLLSGKRGVTETMLQRIANATNTKASVIVSFTPDQSKK